MDDLLEKLFMWAVVVFLWICIGLLITMVVCGALDALDWGAEGFVDR